MLLAASPAPGPVSAAVQTEPRATVTVTVENSAFAPSTVKVAPGDTVTWSFVDALLHTTTSHHGFWNSGNRGAGASYSRVFTSAGSFSYFCTNHPFMQGTVQVRLLASGTPTSGWVLRWASAAGTDSLVYDVQFRKPGSKAWRAFRTDTKAQTGKFNPARNGTYTFRARTDRNVASSGWSPLKKLKVS